MPHPLTHRGQDFSGLSPPFPAHCSSEAAQGKWKRHLVGGCDAGWGRGRGWGSFWPPVGKHKVRITLYSLLLLFLPAPWPPSSLLPPRQVPIFLSPGSMLAEPPVCQSRARQGWVSAQNVDNTAALLPLLLPGWPSSQEASDGESRAYVLSWDGSWDSAYLGAQQDQRRVYIPQVLGLQPAG